MRRYVIGAAAAVAVAGGVAVYPTQTAPGPEMAGSVVKVIVGGGHGSGVHLGNGVILTAGHVVRGQKEVTVQLDTGEIRKAEVHWDTYDNGWDVAKLHVERSNRMASSELSCEPNYVGQDIHIVGNPSGTEFAWTWGRVAGLGKTGLENMTSGGLWRKLIALDITAAPGVSGSPVFDEDGKVVGLLVAGLITTRGNFGYSYMVPGETVCHVMGRSPTPATAPGFYEAIGGI